MNETFYDGHHELYHHAKFGKIAQYAPAVDAKTWCLFFCFCFVLLRAGCHGNLTVLNILSASMAKNQHFRPCSKNYALDRKMIDTFFDGLDELYQHAKFGGRSNYALQL